MKSISNTEIVSPNIIVDKRHSVQSLTGHNGKYRPIPEMSVQEKARFWKKVDRRGPDECWPWVGARRKAKYGTEYGSLSLRGLFYLAHRVAYSLIVGPIPHGLTLDHVVARGCTTALCCNPAHLEPVTQSENSNRYWQANPVTHCKHGHPRERNKDCKPCRRRLVAASQAKKPEKYREMKRLQKQKEREREKQQKTAAD